MNDPFVRVVDAYNRSGVEYVVVGVSGINYYAQTPSQMLSTIDFDIFIKPNAGNTNKAVTCLNEMDYHIFAGDEPLVNFDDFTINKIVEHQVAFLAVSPEDALVENILTITGFSFEEMLTDARTFRSKEIEIKVGLLQKLLKSKELANRPKDRDFFKRYQLILEELSE